MTLVPVEGKPGCYINSDTGEMICISEVAYVEIVWTHYVMDRREQEDVCREAEQRAGSPWRANLGVLPVPTLMLDGKWRYLILVRQAIASSAPQDGPAPEVLPGHVDEFGHR